MGRLDGKVAIVTGAGAGIGRAIAERYATEGARVVVNDVSDQADVVAREIGENAIAVRADVADDASVDRLFADALAAFGTVDVLLCNAALTATERHFLDADREWWDRIIAVNLTGTYNCAVRAARIMCRQRSGVIITMSSGGATRAHRGNAAYDAAKGGIEAFTRALALDLGPYGVRVCGLVPGSVDTKGMNDEARAQRGATMPLGRVGDPEDMAGPAVFLASDDAAYVSGSMVFVDGGFLAQQRSAQVDIFPLSRYPGL